MLTLKFRLDLYSLFRGTMSDVSGLIDIIPSYLFPHDEKPVEEFWMTGISLGGESNLICEILDHPVIRLTTCNLRLQAMSLTNSSRTTPASGSASPSSAAPTTPP